MTEISGFHGPEQLQAYLAMEDIDTSEWKNTPERGTPESLYAELAGGYSRLYTKPDYIEGSGSNIVYRGLSVARIRLVTLADAEVAYFSPRPTPTPEEQSRLPFDTPDQWQAYLLETSKLSVQLHPDDNVIQATITTLKDRIAEIDEDPQQIAVTGRRTTQGTFAYPGIISVYRIYETNVVYPVNKVADLYVPGYAWI